MTKTATDDSGFTIRFLIGKMVKEQQASGVRPTDATIDAFYGELIKLRENNESERAHAFVGEMARHNIKLAKVPNLFKYILDILNR